ncbi:hypothetical protein V5O48_000710 [Marasmius crinis-equi]|uniref:Transmembrane protein n=1 Tax=Marasmius crinis-equi TaxID=585013 RepID=A0ABR3G0X2_9AGAR
MIAMLSVALALFFTLAAQVSAQAPANGSNLIVAVGNDNLTYNQLLNFPFTGVIAPCEQNCKDAKTALESTNGSVTQICSPQVVQSFFTCEQCIFTTLIAANKPKPDPLAGSNPVVTGFAAACLKQANVTVAANQSALALPPSWDGPTGIFVPTIGLVFTVGSGAFLGVSAILILSNI